MSREANADYAAARVDLEHDGGFIFTCKSKKQKTDEPQPAEKPAQGQGRPKKDATKQPKFFDVLIEEEQGQKQPSFLMPRRSSRPKRSTDAPNNEPPPQPPRTTRQGTRQSEEQAIVEEPEQQPQTNGTITAKKRGRKKGSVKTRKSSPVEESPRPQVVPVRSSTIALPMSDTPIINRNKEMRKKGNGKRRSSLGTRGRRASSLIESGQSAIPHRDMDPAHFYKHIESKGLMEPRRMKQLLTWCGERALSAKSHGNPDSSGFLGIMSPETL
ncbi:Mis12-Mtw1 protein family-domain-containing protein [Aspergillus oleicola]